MLGGELHREIRFFRCDGNRFYDNCAALVLPSDTDSGAMCLSVGKCGTRCRNRT